MRRHALLGLVTLAACRGCRACDAGGDGDSAPDTQQQDSVPDDSGDSGPILPTRCDVNESEPNDQPGDEDDLPMEAVGCGDLQRELDADLWGFEVETGSWVTVSVAGDSIGSRARTSLVLFAEDAAETAQVYGSRAGGDTRIVFPAWPDEYTALVSEIDALGGPEDYFYEILASETKEPTTWTGVEAEPNGVPSQAQTVVSGDAIFADVATGVDIDWYAVMVPAGRHLVRLDFDAAELGSAAAMATALYDADEVRLRGWPPAGTGFEDPLAEWVSPGDELLYIKVAERQQRGGRAYWYVMRVTLEPQ